MIGGKVSKVTTNVILTANVIKKRLGIELTPEVVARVAPAARRLFHTGAEGARVLIVGGAPGQAYEPAQWSSTGE